MKNIGSILEHGMGEIEDIMGIGDIEVIMDEPECSSKNGPFSGL